jgi:NADH-quinone oxidoreductase subunit N
LLLALVLPESPAAGATIQLGGLWLYLVGYAISTAGALTALAALSGRDDLGDELHNLGGQARAYPLHGLVLTVFIASFAGLPPTLGFVGKFVVIGGLVQTGYLIVAIVAMILAIVAMAYYLKLLIALWAPVTRDPAPTGHLALTQWTTALAAIAVVALIAVAGRFTQPVVIAAPQTAAATTAP